MTTAVRREMLIAPPSSSESLSYVGKNRPNLPRLAPILDLFGSDWHSVYAGELEVRPPEAPSTSPTAGRSAQPQVVSARTTLGSRLRERVAPGRSRGARTTPRLATAG